VSLEAVLARMLAAGQITPDDADEIRECAAYLREPVDPLGRSEFQRAMPSVSETATGEALTPPCGIWGETYPHHHDDEVVEQDHLGLGPLRQGWA
jgi:hypothetical protein